MSIQSNADYHDKVLAGIQAAVNKTLEEHRRAGRSVVVWRDGQIVTLAPEEIPVPRPDTSTGTD